MAADKKDEKKSKERFVVKLDMMERGDKSAIARIVKEVQKAFKETPSVITMNPQAGAIIKYRTGIASLDRALGVGGIYGGRIVNCWGWEGTGKTLTGMAVGGEVQRQGGVVAFLDAEGTFSPLFAAACGLDVEQLIYVRSTPDRVMAGEDFLETARVLIAQGVDFVLVDSAAALVPSQRLQQSFGEGQQATQARMLSDELQKMTQYLSAGQRTIVWFTNQMRGKPMEMFGAKEGPTGGNALPFYQSYGFQMMKVKDIIAKVKTQDGRIEEKIIGASVGLRITKNKTAPKPVSPVLFDIYTSFQTLEDGTEIKPGIDIIKDMFEVGTALGVIEQKGAWYSFGGIRGQGMPDFCEALRGSPKVIEAMRERIVGITPATEEVEDETEPA
jgi:recombination protein RecA